VSTSQTKMQGVGCCFIEGESGERLGEGSGDAKWGIAERVEDICENRANALIKVGRLPVESPSVL